ncbi:MAG TPA: NusG domain II-containing protein [Clostridia bacterium]|nr:NusG domain II-containing protein [Clostridia bacterium]
MKAKVGDVLVYVFIVLAIGLSFLGLKTMGTPGNTTLLIIELDGSPLESIELGSDESHREIKIDTGDGGYNTILISEGEAEMLDANCPDRLCVHSPRIKVSGQSIVCIPHRVVIRITGDTQGDNTVDDTAS